MELPPTRCRGGPAVDHRFQDGAVKPVVALTVTLVEISASFQMLEYALKRLTDAVGGRSLYQPTLKIALNNYNVVDLSTGGLSKNYFRFELRHLEI